MGVDLIGFKAEVEAVSEDSQLIAECLQQLTKDFVLSGVNIESDNEPRTGPELLVWLKAIIDEAQSNNPNWVNVYYHLDLPNHLEKQQLNLTDFTLIVAHRAWMKVMSRRHFSNR